MSISLNGLIRNSLMEQSQAFDSASMDGKADLLRKEFRLGLPIVPPFGDRRYLTQLFISEKQVQRDELLIGLEPEDANIGANHQKIQDKIYAALKLLTFREQRVLVQFWSCFMVQKPWLLATKDQPFGVGLIDDGLLTYRRDSELKSFIIGEVHEEDCPVVRVFRRGLQEWTPDVTNYLLTQFPQLECSKLHNLHGYLALPVFDSATALCVGVLELLTSSKYTSYAYEVQQFHNALEVHDEQRQRQKDHNNIHSILKSTCDIHGLPLAQTWVLSEHTSFVAHEKVIENSCSSFDTRCVGKVCMSTAALPFHVKDGGAWSFREACRVQHLDRSRGIVGKALSTRGCCFCGDVTKFSEKEYPLVGHALRNRLTSCFAILLHSVEADHDYVLEFFLPADIKDSGQVLNVVQTLKQSIPIGSRFELGDTSMIQVVGQPTDLFESVVTDVIQTSSASVAYNFLSSDSDSDSLVSTGSTDAGQKSKRSRKRKIGPEVMGMVTAKITFNDDEKIFHFSLSSGLFNLEREVVQRFKLKGRSPRLKYKDEDADLILITCDVDLRLAIGSRDTINLICLPGT